MSLHPETVQQIAKNHYQLDAVATVLNGYEEQNFLLQTAGGGQYIFKAAPGNVNPAFIQAQVTVLQQLAQTPVRDYFQHCLLNGEGAAVTFYAQGDAGYYVRILSFLEGHFWVEEKEKSPALYESLGRFLGAMDRALEGQYYTAAERTYEWDISRAADAEKNLHHIHDPEKRRIAAYFLLQFQTEVAPQLSSLRKACIHNDANDYNVLIQDGRVSGLIDFGDMVWSALINNLAVACTYAMLHTDDPVAVAAPIVKAYHRQCPLTPAETDLIYYLVAARLCISVTQSAEKASHHSDNTHHFLTEQPAWTLLFQLLQTNPIKAADAFRNACGFNPLIDANDDYAALLSGRKAHIGRNLSISYKKPLKIIKGALQYLYDDKGHTFIDCVNNVSHVGHCHPVVVKAMQRQIATLNTNTRYLNDAMMDYAKALTAKLPSRLSVCYFTNSGSEANDLAIRMARHFTGNKDVIVLDHAYHGTSTLAIEMSPYKFDGKGGGGQQPYIHKAVSPDLYRGAWQYGDADAGEKYAAAILKLLHELKQEHKGPAAFICETLLGVGGQIPLPEGYLENVYAHIRAFGGLCIADEVQVGFGRVGDAFWGFELQGVEPDMVVLGKPIGNGHPLAAVVVTEAIADAFNNGMEYFNTYGGNPVSMVTGQAVLKVIEEEAMQQHAQQVGAVLLEELKALMDKYEIIGDVRGHGLFVGAEFVKSRSTREPAVTEINHVVEQMKERGFLLSTDGPLYNVLKIKPPLVFSEQNARDMVAALDAVLRAEAFG
ncbi:aminotransferase class III-fold pyridoxal phosphate-dependent enzyme [Niabella pedocola]|uniref:Aminotransferase class III-fold pyridoxal phosphate-dependent enzyme n=1 Tax=Niabella pedocola TaxID=1752077 RepID=A0ABS8PY07_9BACT|nr:aminotransferase class III-fold pyridoxal phosphate-dependent enzyme [Niabella pedocola]MCD2424806.1 aminotransferase class III-fold pyridoxal phosphate-dependent enzyme [Niabella pedocola]